MAGMFEKIARILPGLSRFAETQLRIMPQCELFLFAVEAVQVNPSFRAGWMNQQKKTRAVGELHNFVAGL